jgi:transcriptional regulator with XRE-family HTH domain
MATSTLKILREINNYTQDFVAEEVLGMSQPSYARLEQSPEKITADQAQKLSQLYSVSIANLLSEATPVITFKDSINKNPNSVNGYFHSNTNNYHEGEITTLKSEIEYLRKQNMELLKLVGEKK